MGRLTDGELYRARFRSMVVTPSPTTADAAQSQLPQEVHCPTGSCAHLRGVRRKPSDPGQPGLCFSLQAQGWLLFHSPHSLSLRPEASLTTPDPCTPISSLSSPSDVQLHMAKTETSLTPSSSTRLAAQAEIHSCPVRPPDPPPHPPAHLKPHQSLCSQPAQPPPSLGTIPLWATPMTPSQSSSSHPDSSELPEGSLKNALEAKAGGSREPLHWRCHLLPGCLPAGWSRCMVALGVSSERSLADHQAPHSLSYPLHQRFPFPDDACPLGMQASWEFSPSASAVAGRPPSPLTTPVPLECRPRGNSAHLQVQWQGGPLLP
ncbi:uncharacterized protein LOC124900646 isoform X2 [Homo sapiens]|uniref:uncharacterized protein LOC124900646 isoform X2 n=1 Tax=Homo sapiens TaxID=9606 RepID=UPI0023DF6951|nr:uncharacterized protein LOC124900646 isoform X2 [Homo sapiens]